jgi:hypothetical protein
VATEAYKETIVGALPNNEYQSTSGLNADPAAAALAADTDAATASADAVLADAASDATVAAKLDITAVDAAVGVLVADGASPTEAHVTALSDAWTTLKAANTALNSAIDDGKTATALVVTDTATVNADTTAVIAAVSGDLTILVNKANIDTKNKFVSLLRKLQRRIEGSY